MELHNIVLRATFAALALSLHLPSACYAVDVDQQSLQNEDLSSRAEEFIPRYIFHHDLEDAGLQSTSFVPLPSAHQVDIFGEIQSSSVTKKLMIRRTKNNAGPDADSAYSDRFTRPATFPVPEVTHKDTVINLARMAADVYYVDSTDSGWRNLTQGIKDRIPFGYKMDGLQGHIFSNFDNSTVIVAFKGSSVIPYDTTRPNDRLNDNLLFSCCCAAQRPDPYWYGEVCHCPQDVYRCSSSCLTHELSRKDRYYAAAKSIVEIVIHDLFPSSAILSTGHSLGGSLASLMGLTFGFPAITFEAPPERLPAQRLGLVPPGPTRKGTPVPPTYHFGNTADPVYMGACNGAFSSCAVTGFAFESQCFTGKKCVYDTVRDKGWFTDVGNHRIDTVIDDVLKAYKEVPPCEDERSDCGDCFNWIFD